MSETSDTAAAKLVALLEAIADVDSDARDGLSVTELARALKRDKSVVSRQLKPLVELGVITRTEDGRHSIGWRLFAIAAQAGDQRLLLLAPPVMRRLTQLVRERVHFSILRGADVFTIMSESPQRTIQAVGWVGRVSPLTSTSSGRVLLFDRSDDDIRELFSRHFPRGEGSNAPRNVDELIERVRVARAEGFAWVENEFDEDLTALAAPVRDMRGHIVGALNVSAPSYRMQGDRSAASRSLIGAATHLSSLLASPGGETTA
ncbi:IclR family transcriptional regulator [Nocardioides sp. LHG3406-4]|uniref:IclR family transcriptional regulator n=1 Tax=Nocardioides sp. LHG3406-4 TaxID=2804575 RepID=UPI003CF9C75D